MNIKEHIEAGHYPLKDEKGRPVVPMRDERRAVICATDGPDGEELVGWHSGHESEGDAVCSWSATGAWCDRPAALDLLPPPPRKVKVTAKLRRNDQGCWVLDRVSRDGDGVALIPIGTTIELTGEYEEPWS